MAPKKNSVQGSKPSASAQSSSSGAKKPVKQGTPIPEPAKKPNPKVEGESAKSADPSDKNPAKRDIDKFHSPKICGEGFGVEKETLAEKVVKVQKLAQETEDGGATTEVQTATGTETVESLESSVKSKGISKGKEKQIVKQTRKDHVDFLKRIGYPEIGKRASNKFEWTETNENHRQQRYLGILMNGTALSFGRARSSSILIMNCDDPMDADESPMSAFARNQVMTQNVTGCLTINLWGYGNPNLTAYDVVVFLIGRLFEKGGSEDLTLPIDDDDPDLIAAVEQLVHSRLRGNQVLIILDGLALFGDGDEVAGEDELADIKSKVSKVLSPIKTSEAAKKPAPSKKAAATPTARPEKKAQASKKSGSSTKAEASKKPEPSKKPESASNKPKTGEKVAAQKNAIDTKKQGEDQQSKGKGKAEPTEVEEETASGLLSRLVNTLIGIAKQDLGPGHFPLKLIFINPMRSDVMAAVQSENPDIPVITVPTAKEFAERYPSGIMLPGPLGSIIRP